MQVQKGDTQLVNKKSDTKYEMTMLHYNINNINKLQGKMTIVTSD